ncbi:hypothetical protein N2152v2_006790 [Parachlorella kessleri]
MQRKKRTHIRVDQDPAKKGQPKSFVFRRGRHGAILKELEKDLRKLMAPNTATNLKESKRNVLKDFVHIAGPLGVTHFLMLTATHNASYLRIAKPPRGPTITMRIHEYSLVRDVVAAQQRPRMPQTMWQGPPLVVMNNFGQEEHMRLASVTFQHMFPAINVQTTKLSACQASGWALAWRVLLLDYSKESGRISVRHFSILAQPSGVTKNLKALLARKKVPDMSRLADVSEFLTKSGYGSESEGEEAEQSRVELPAEGAKGPASRQTRVRLFEVGPRLELEVVKVEEGLCDGRVLFHKYVKKTAEEAAAQQSELEQARALKEQRRKQQEENVRRKESKRKEAEGPQEGGRGQRDKKRARGPAGGAWWARNEEGQQGENANDDDVEYYRQEVGEEPEDTIGLNNSSRGGGFQRGPKFGRGRGGGGFQRRQRGGAGGGGGRGGGGGSRGSGRGRGGGGERRDRGGFEGGRRKEGGEGKRGLGERGAGGSKKHKTR